jgi:uncharacterized protein YbjQ (UPF0145 family)
VVSQSPYRSGETPPPPIVVTTGEEIPGASIVAILGVVRGVALRRNPMQQDLESAIAARQAAEQRLVEEAKGLRAEAVIGMRYDSNDREVVAYGTAVRLRRDQPKGA